MQTEMSFIQQFITKVRKTFLTLGYDLLYFRQLMVMDAAQLKAMERVNMVGLFNGRKENDSSIDESPPHDSRKG